MTNIDRIIFLSLYGAQELTTVRVYKAKDPCTIMCGSLEYSTICKFMAYYMKFIRRTHTHTQAPARANKSNIYHNSNVSRFTQSFPEMVYYTVVANTRICRIAPLPRSVNRSSIPDRVDDMIQVYYSKTNFENFWSQLLRIQFSHHNLCQIRQIYYCFHFVSDRRLAVVCAHYQ